MAYPGDPGLGGILLQRPQSEAFSDGCELPSAGYFIFSESLAEDLANNGNQ